MCCLHCLLSGLSITGPEPGLLPTISVQVTHYYKENICCKTCTEASKRWWHIIIIVSIIIVYETVYVLFHGLQQISCDV